MLPRQKVNCVSTVTLLTYITAILLQLPCGSHTLRRKTHSQMVQEQISMTSNVPQNVHISFGSTSKDIVVMWSTKRNEEGVVEYGDSPSTLKKVTGKTTQLTISSDRSLKFVHRAELLNLIPGKRYSYRIVVGQSNAKSSTFFVNVPHNETQRPHSFLVMADVGLLTKHLQFLIHEAMNNKYEAVFHIGDIAYNLDYDQGSHGDKFLGKVQKFASQIPYMTSPGDHERFHNFHHYRHRFSLPNLPWPMEEKLWYSINIGMAHFISIDTEALIGNVTLKEIQLKWLEEDLLKANQNRQNVPWIIVLGHKPVYCAKALDSQDCYGKDSIVRGSLEDLFFEQGVDMYLSGHKHCYERTWPVYKGKTFQTNNIEPKAPIYIIIGAMGYEYMTDAQYSQEYWLAFASSDREKELYARLGVLNSTHLTWSVHAVSNNEEVDKIHVVQNHHGSFGKAGMEALEKLKNMQLSVGSKLPPQPFFFIDEQPSKFSDYSSTDFQRVFIFGSVFTLSLLLFVFLRHYARFKKSLKIPCLQ